MPARFAALILTAAPPGVGGDSSGSMVKIDGREALVRSVELFLNRENIEQTIVAFQPESLEEGKKKHGGHFGFTGVRVVGGGPRWLDQIAAAMKIVPPEITHVIVHDAARPAVPYTDLEAILSAAESHEAVTLIAPLRATLLEVDEAHQPVGYRNASEFLQELTPQVFSRKRAERCVDEKSLPHASELHVIPGSPLNMRVNSGADAAIAKALINLLPKPKIKANSPFEEAQW